MPEMPDHYVQRVPIGRVMTNKDLADEFRPCGKFPALGPFKVYSPETNHWTWGWDLEYEGLDLHFQDSTPEGVTIGFNNFIVNAGEHGRMIWIQGGDETDYALYVLTPAEEGELVNLCVGHFRENLVKPRGSLHMQGLVESTLKTFDDAAAAAHYLLETKRWKDAGLGEGVRLASGFGLIVAVESGLPVMGLFHVSRQGRLLRRVDGMWVDADPSLQLWADSGRSGISALWVPMLSSIVPRYDERAGADEMALGASRLDRLRFPRDVFHDLPQGPEWVNDVAARLPVAPVSDPLDRVKAKLVMVPTEPPEVIHEDDLGDPEGDDE